MQQLPLRLLSLKKLLHRMWYGCGTSPATDSCLGLCLATSKDGIAWSKAPLDVVPGAQAPRRPKPSPSWGKYSRVIAISHESGSSCHCTGTNIVINQVLKSNNLWLDHEDTNASRRYKLADTGGTNPATGAFAASYRLWSSADGVHWSVEKDYTGPTSDRATVFPNMLRSPRRWTYSIKNYRKSGEVFGRSRLYWETEGDDLYSAMWSEDDPVDWQAAEDLDPGYVVGLDGKPAGEPAQLCESRPG